MDEGFSDHKLINHTSILVLTGRLFLVVAILILQSYGGFSGIETWNLIYVLGPLTMLYSMAFARFIIRFPYTMEHLKVRKISARTTLLFSYSSLVAYLGGVVVNALYKSVLSFQNLLKILFVGELLNAIFIASYLSFLFEIRERSEMD